MRSGLPTRREFLEVLAAMGVGSTLTAGHSGMLAAAEHDGTSEKPRVPTRVAAIQMHPKLGDVAANLDKAKSLVRTALNRGAKWIVLPEFFSSGLALHPSVFSAHRPLDGEPTQMLRDLAREGNAHVGGSFLARSGNDVFNTFVLACPNGEILTHDKDIPSTVFESSVYAGGEDAEFVRLLAKAGITTKSPKIPPRQGNCASGVFEIAGLSIGAALCWELVRYRTARRLVGVDLLLGASGWWWSDPEYGWPDGRIKEEIRESRKTQKNLIRDAPRRFARMLGVPVIHANFCGANAGYLTTEFKTKVKARYLGESQIVDAKGEPLASISDNEGVAVADVMLGRTEPSETIPASQEWMPEITDRAKDLWHESGALGRDYYLETVRPRLNR